MNVDDMDMLDEYDFSNAKQGPIVRVGPNKTRITIRIDTDILDWFRQLVNDQGGGSYQTLINQALRDHIMHQQGEWQEPLRRMIREELEHNLYTVHPSDVSQGKQLRPYGLAKSEFRVPPDFDAPLPDDVVKEFEGA